ncbi:MAG: glycoside hydrolase family 88 protein [Nitriliruptoraceae bacterium]|nr:glycoside hydrolase family 88 protein [Nitriliruptoraceae bacterium]
MTTVDTPTATADAPDLDVATLTERLRAVADTLPGLGYTGWGFGDSVAFEGMIEASKVLGDETWRSFARGFIRAWALEASPYERLDCTAAGLAMVRIGEVIGDARVTEAAIGLADYLVARPRIGALFATWEHSPLQHAYGPDSLPPDEVALLASPPPGVFIDCLHFDPPFLVALGLLVGRDDLVEEGVRQARGYVEVLQQDDGTFDHFVLEGSERTYGAGWGRGQGWALLGLLDVLEDLPEGHEATADLTRATVRLIEAMLRTQRDDGHWYAVVHDPASGDETSTAAFMADGFLRALRLGVVGDGSDADRIEAAADAALRAALHDTDEGGNLAGVSAAVNACTLQSHYAHVPRGFIVPWGQGPLATALAERLRRVRGGDVAPAGAGSIG